MSLTACIHCDTDSSLEIFKRQGKLQFLSLGFKYYKYIKPEQ